jgi:four helix bundle protein
MEGSSFRDLRMWQQAIELALSVYRFSEAFPKHEVYGLSQQMRRAAVSVASNIAEGKGHRSDKEFRHFLFHARGSLMELETQILLAGKLQYLSAEQSALLQGTATQVGRSLTGLINSLNSRAA